MKTVWLVWYVTVAGDESLDCIFATEQAAKKYTERWKTPKDYACWYIEENKVEE